MPATLGIVASQRSVTTPTGPPMTGLVAWWDAADTSTFTFSSGNSVSQWNDKSGGNKHASWVNSSWPATRVAAAINGLHAVDFHPGGLNTPLSSARQPLTFIAAVKTGPTNSGVSLIGQSYQNTGDYINWDISGGLMRLVRRGSVVLIGAASSPFTANTPTVVGATWDASNVWTHYRNGVAVGTGTTSAPIAPSALVGLGLLEVPNSGNYDGLAGEVLIYDRVLTTVVRQQAELYLKTKWGTP